MAEYKVVTIGDLEIDDVAVVTLEWPNGPVIFNAKVMEQGRRTEGQITMIREVTENGQEIPMSRPVLSNTRVG